MTNKLEIIQGFLQQLVYAHLGVVLGVFGSSNATKAFLRQLPSTIFIFHLDSFSLYFSTLINSSVDIHKMYCFQYLKLEKMQGQNR